MSNNKMQAKVLGKPIAKGPPIPFTAVKDDPSSMQPVALSSPVRPADRLTQVAAGYELTPANVRVGRIVVKVPMGKDTWCHAVAYTCIAEEDGQVMIPDIVGAGSTTPFYLPCASTVVSEKEFRALTSEKQARCLQGPDGRIHYVALEGSELRYVGPDFYSGMYIANSVPLAPHGKTANCKLVLLGPEQVQAYASLMPAKLQPALEGTCVLLCTTSKISARGVFYLPARPLRTMAQIEEAKAEALRIAKAEALRIAKAEALRIAEAEALRIAKAEALRIAEAEALRIAKAEALRIAKAEALRIAKAESMRIAKAEALRIAKAEALRIAEAEALRIAKAEALRIAEAEALRIAKAEALRIAKAESMRIAKAEALRIAKAESMRIAEAEALRIAKKAESMRIAKAEALRIAKKARRIAEGVDACFRSETGLDGSPPAKRTRLSVPVRTFERGKYHTGSEAAALEQAKGQPHAIEKAQGSPHIESADQMQLLAGTIGSSVEAIGALVYDMLKRNEDFQREMFDQMEKSHRDHARGMEQLVAILLESLPPRNATRALPERRSVVSVASTTAPIQKPGR